MNVYAKPINNVQMETSIKKLNEDPTRKHSEIVLSITPWKVLKSKSYHALQLLKNLLQTTSEHHDSIFYQKYINQTFPEDQSYAQLNDILARF